MRHGIFLFFTLSSPGQARLASLWMQRQTRIQLQYNARPHFPFSGFNDLAQPTLGKVYKYPKQERIQGRPVRLSPQRPNFTDI